MNILVLLIEKTNEAYLNEGINQYIKRLSNYCSLHISTINVPKNLRQRTQSEQKRGEADLILKELKDSDYVVVLDEKGKEISSEEFALFIQKQQLNSSKRLVFIVGGPFGFDQKIYDKANFKLSLSSMTFSHQMVRLFFLEQLYRAFTILKGEKYHH